ncbi:MAG TPA: hypothetical protein PLP05_01975, partial [Sedimentisphaerales bacterium]|nr:hypothetical protein [Sedimentisphaerales bacterium]
MGLSFVDIAVFVLFLVGVVAIGLLKSRSEKNTNEDYSKILIKKNAELIKSIQGSNDLKVNETPVVSKEKLIAAIIAKY